MLQPQRRQGWLSLLPGRAANASRWGGEPPGSIWGMILPATLPQGAGGLAQGLVLDPSWFCAWSFAALTTGRQVFAVWISSGWQIPAPFAAPARGIQGAATTACSQGSTDATNPQLQSGCCQLEAANPPRDRGRAWPRSTARTPALLRASAEVTSLLRLAPGQGVWCQPPTPWGSQVLLRRVRQISAHGLRAETSSWQRRDSPAQSHLGEASPHAPAVLSVHGLNGGERGLWQSKQGGDLALSWQVQVGGEENLSPEDAAAQQRWVQRSLQPCWAELWNAAGELPAVCLQVSATGAGKSGD